MGVKCAAVNKILFCILLFVLFSCKNENHKVDRGEIFIANLDSTCTSEFKYSDLYKKVTAIILDNKEVMLTEISKMLVYKDKLYLLDRRAQGVYAFVKMVVLFVNSEIWVQDRMNMSVAMILELMLTQGNLYI